jgi:DNA-binding NtrC family response regulator
MQDAYRLLIVDDDPNMIRVLRAELASQPYEIVTAPSANEAMPILRDLLPEVIVTDFNMPGMLGTQLLAHASAIFPVGGRILITGSPSLDMAVEAINLGAVSRLFIKPFNPTLLTEAIRAEMERIETARMTDQLLAQSHEPKATGAVHADDYRPYDRQEIFMRLRRALRTTA